MLQACTHAHACIDSSLHQPAAGDSMSASFFRAEMLERQLADLQAGLSASQLRGDTATQELAALIASDQAKASALELESKLLADAARLDNTLADYQAAQLRPSASCMSADAAERALADYKAAQLRGLRVLSVDRSSKNQMQADRVEKAFADYNALHPTPEVVVDPALRHLQPMAKTSSILRAEEAEKKIAALEAKVAAMGRISAAAGRTQADLLEQQLIDMQNKSSLRNTRIRELEAEINIMHVREERAGIDRLEEINTVLFKSFQLDLVFLVDSTGSMLQTIKMVGMVEPVSGPQKRQ